MWSKHCRVSRRSTGTVDSWSSGYSERERISGGANERSKKTFYRDGYIVLKRAVANELVDAALKRIRLAKKRENIDSDPAMTDLVNASSVRPVLTDMIGEFDPPVACQVWVVKPRGSGEHVNSVGYKDKDMPYYGAETHLDGSITISKLKRCSWVPPRKFIVGILGRVQKGGLGRRAYVMGHNMVPMFEDPAMTLGLESFTALAFVCLSDQT